MQWVLDLNDELGQQLLDFAQEAGLTKIEFLNCSFTLTKWAIQHVQQGHLIAAVDEAARTYSEVQMAFLDTFKPAEPSHQ